MTKRKFLLVIWFLLLSSAVSAHCDTLQGPVVSAARSALETGNVNLALIWVQKADEFKIRRSFEETLAMRRSNPDAAREADVKFFETLVSVHRAGEGVPYAGLQHEKRVSAEIQSADEAIASDSPEKLIQLLNSELRAGVLKRYDEVMDLMNYDPNDVEAGRAYVRAYVEYTHYVEHLFESAREESEHFSENDGGVGQSAVWLAVFGAVFVFLIVLCVALLTRSDN